MTVVELTALLIRWKRELFHLLHNSWGEKGLHTDRLLSCINSEALQLLEVFLLQGELDIFAYSLYRVDSRVEQSI